MQEITISLQNYQELTIRGELITSKTVPLWNLHRTGTVELYKLEPEKYPTLHAGKYLLAIESLPGSYEIRKFYDGEALLEYFQNLTLDADHPLRRSGVEVFFSAAESEKELQPLYTAYVNFIGMNGATTGEIEKQVRKQTEVRKAGWSEEWAYQHKN